MRLSTSTNICAFTAGRERLPVEFSIDVCARAGYHVLDINFCMAMNPDSPLRGDNWQAYIAHIAQYADERDVKFSQAHLPYYDVFGRHKDPSFAGMMDKLIQRCVIAAGMLNVPWVVTHPVTVVGSSDSLDRNLSYYAPYVYLARERGVGVAFENDFSPNCARGQVFGASVIELNALINAFGDENVGACYDFGHGNLSGGQHRRNLNLLGDRLKATHVQDNHGLTDEHLMPFFGSIDWADAMAGLRDIGYQGDLTYEIQEFGRYLPKELKHLVVEQSLVIGQTLLRMAGQGI